MAPKKKITALIKLQIQAGAATPAPPVGPALGQHGVNIMEFVKAYNAATESQKGQIIPVFSYSSQDQGCKHHHGSGSGNCKDQDGRSKCK